jgi:hypothetical protein
MASNGYDYSMESERKSPMKKRVLMIMAGLILTVLAFSQLTLNGDEQEEDAWKVPFRDLGPISVRVPDLGQEGRYAGVTTEELKAFVEFKLRQNRIPVNSQADGLRTPNSPQIDVSVDLMYLEELDHFVYYIQLGLLRQVRLLRNRQQLTAVTWETGAFGIAPPRRIRTKIKDNLDQWLTVFINDYQGSQNPSENVHSVREDNWGSLGVGGVWGGVWEEVWEEFGSLWEFGGPALSLIFYLQSFSRYGCQEYHFGGNIENYGILCWASQKTITTGVRIYVL